MKFLSRLLVTATICVAFSFCYELQNSVSLGRALFAGFPGGFMTDTILKMIIKGIQDQLTALKDESNSVCVEQLNFTLTGLVNKELWALSMIDAWGKIPAGMLNGNLIELGSYDECLKVYHEPGGDLKPIQGQYCLPTIPFDVLQSMIPNVGMRVLPQAGVLALRIGMCTPATCTPEILQKIFGGLLGLNQSQFAINDLVCNVKEEQKFSGTDIFGISFFGVFIGLVAISTIYDYVATALGREKRKLLIAFSVITNSRKLLKVEYKSSGDVMECLNGIRCLSIIWVVYGHSYLMAVFSPIINYAYIVEWMKNYYSMLILTATISVDSFFLLSGLLVTWTVLKQLEKTGGKLNIPLMYFHRYLRLTPVIAASIIFSVSIIKYLGSGPFWKFAMGVSVPLCEQNWWVTLLYIQNYHHSGAICLGHTWYLAVDMQLYILSPLILIPLWKWKRRFIPVILLLILLSMSVTFALFMVNHYSVGVLDDLLNVTEKMRLTYYATHSRAGAWLVGVLLGYLLHCYRGRRIIIPKVAVLAGWILSLATIAAIIWGPHQIMQPETPPTVLESSFYETFSRVCWAIALSWIILACTQGYGGPINSFLSFPLWQPLGRLSYCIYITHMIIQLLQLGNSRTSSYFSDFEVISKFWSYFGMTIFISTIVSLVFESPIIVLEKLIFKSKPDQPAPSQENIAQPDTDQNDSKFYA